jgi:hypothetical protein
VKIFINYWRLNARGAAFIVAISIMTTVKGRFALFLPHNEAVALSFRNEMNYGFSVR